jgi:hypothetical protein
MARPAKVRSGEKRTVLFRDDQLEALQHLTRTTGRDFSDLVRVAVDWVFTSAGPGPSRTAEQRERARNQAALELARRQLVRVPALARAVRAGWAGATMTLPLGERVSPADVRLVRQAVELLGRLGIPPPQEPAGRPGEFGTLPTGEPADSLPIPPDWATGVPDRLLTVLCSPAVVAVSFTTANGFLWPEQFEASPRICPPHGPPRIGAGVPPPEPQYTAASEALAELRRRDEVVDYYLHDPDARLRTIGVRYSIKWDKLGRPGPPGTTD